MSTDPKENWDDAEPLSQRLTALVNLVFTVL